MGRKIGCCNTLGGVLSVINSLSDEGITALHLACKRCNFEVVKFLVENGAEANAKDEEQKGALHVAAEAGHVGIVKYLVEKGAQMNVKDKDSKVPLDLARCKGHDEVVKYLEDEHAKINKARSLALKFYHPCCIRVVPYKNNGEGTYSFTMCVYVDSDDGIPHDLEVEAKNTFLGYNIEYEDLQRPCREIITELPSTKKTHAENLSDLFRKIEKNLHVFEKRVNVTAVGASYKVTGLEEKNIPCVTVFVIDKGRTPAGETDISEIKENYGELFGNAEFDVVVGYFKLANSNKPLNASHASPLRGGVGIGVQGSDGAGTLGGFLQDEDGNCYILSCEHVLNPSMIRKDGTKERVQFAGTSGQLLENVHTSDVKQPAPSDYVEINKVASKMLKERQDQLVQYDKHIEKNRQDGTTDTQLDELKKTCETKIEYLKKDIEDKPRNVGSYICGVQKNVKPKSVRLDNQMFFVDVAIAELKTEERTKMEKEIETCRLYGFTNEDGFNADGEILPLEGIVKTLKSKEPKFVKFGRTTGFTNGGFIDDSVPKLFVNSTLDKPPDPKSFFIHAQYLFCENCLVEPDAKKGASAKKTRDVCMKCKNELKVEDKDDGKSDVWSYWVHNCFPIRKNRHSFSEKGDSGSILFDNEGVAWGLVWATFTHPNKNTDYCLASPLDVALEALEEECKKKQLKIKGLKLWCRKPEKKNPEGSKGEEPLVNETEESKCKELEEKETEGSKCDETAVNETEGSKCEKPGENETNYKIRGLPCDFV